MECNGFTEAEVEKLPQPNLKEVNGIWLPPYITKERIDQIPKAPVRPDDIFVATFPRCGTTWTQELVWQILHNGRQDERTLDQRFPWYEAGPWLAEAKFFVNSSQAQVEMDSLPSPRLMKTHLPVHLMPMGVSARPAQCKCIYVMRNPKDVALSFYHQLFSLKFFEYDGTWEQYLPLFMAGRVEFGSWYDHVLGWWSHRDDPNILFLQYEDMKKNLPSNVSKICKFLGKKLTSEEVKLISKQCTFEVMKTNSATNKYYFDSVRKPNTCTFMRKGEVGDWKNYFTDEQNEMFDKHYAEKMKGSGLDFEWE